MESQSYYSNRRRIRANAHIRELASSVYLNHKTFIQPLFVDESIHARTPINSLHEVNSDTIDSMILQIESDIQSGVTKFLLFPVPLKKTENNFDFSFVLKALKTIRDNFGNTIWVAADLCLCAYTSHGHCGVLNEHKSAVLNDASVKIIADYALQLVEAGADCIAPSDMMDGRIQAIRTILNTNGFDNKAIMSYSAKFSSQFYGPFRDACKSSPGKDCLISDRRTYQSSPFNGVDAILSTIRDIGEGADMVMVKPALAYLDIVQKIKEQTQFPLAAYHVSGEYQSIELLAQQQLVDRSKAHVEVWTAIKRAGADIIISYAARHAQNWIKEINY